MRSQFHPEIPCRYWLRMLVPSMPVASHQTVMFPFLPGPTRLLTAPHTGKKVLTGSDLLLLTTPTSESPLLKWTPTDARFALDGGITSLAVNSSSALAVVGGANGGVRVVSLSKGEVVGSLEGHKEGESVEGVAWMEYAGIEVAATAGTDGKVCVWD